jgi:transposase InsO family protein
MRSSLRHYPLGVAFFSIGEGTHRLCRTILNRRFFFVLVDAHSKWPELVEMTTTTSTKTIEVLRSIFSPYGIPAQIVSDNGSQFSSDEFAILMKRNGIKHF